MPDSTTRRRTLSHASGPDCELSRPRVAAIARGCRHSHRAEARGPQHPGTVRTKQDRVADRLHELHRAVHLVAHASFVRDGSSAARSSHSSRAPARHDVRDNWCEETSMSMNSRSNGLAVSRAVSSPDMPIMCSGTPSSPTLDPVGDQVLEIASTSAKVGAVTLCSRRLDAGRHQQWRRRAGRTSGFRAWPRSALRGLR